MKVLIVGPSLEPEIGGVAHYYNAVLPWLRRLDLEVAYLEIGSHHGARRFRHIVSDQLRFGAALEALQPDLVHLNPSFDLRSFIRDGAFVAQSRRRRVPVLVFFRGWDNAFDEFSERRLSWFFARTYARADGFVVLGTRFADRLRAKGIKAPIFRTHTAVPDGALESFSVDDKIERLGARDVLRLLFMARLDKKKGAEEVIDATAALRRRNVPVRLSVAGEGAESRRLREKVARMGLAEDVAFLGYVRGKDKAAVLQQHDVYCLPSDHAEGMPNSVLEAMAFGMAIVTLPTGGIPDFFEEGKMGILLEKRSAADVERAVASLLRDRAGLGQIAGYNHGYAKRHFLASGCASALFGFYREISFRSSN